MAEALPVACVGMTFEGWCNAHHGTEHVWGVIEEEGSGFLTIEGKRIAVTGTKVRGSCGHTGTIIGGSRIFRIEGLPVAREGDRIERMDGDSIEGVIIEGSDFISSE